MKSRRFLIAILLLWCQGALGAASTISFTPLSVKVPLRGVFMSGWDENGARHTSELRNCKSGGDACFVDLADQAALDSLFSGTTAVAVGNYSSLTVATCFNEGTYQAQLMGLVDIGGTTYYTASGPDPLSLNIADLGPVTVTFSGCQRDYALPAEVQATKDSPLEVSLFFPIRNVAYASLGPSPIPEGCLQNPGGTHSVCLAYPDATPYVGHTEPTLETYLIYEPPNTPDTAGGQILLIADASDRLIGGTTRPYYQDNTLSGHTNFDTPLRIFTDNGDGTYHLENFGSTADTSYAIFPRFERRSHAATYISNNFAGATFNYGALLVP